MNNPTSPLQDIIMKRFSHGIASRLLRMIGFSDMEAPVETGTKSREEQEEEERIRILVAKNEEAEQRMCAFKDRLQNDLDFREKWLKKHEEWVKEHPRRFM